MPTTLDFDALKRTARTLEVELSRRLPATRNQDGLNKEEDVQETKRLLNEFSSTLENLGKAQAYSQAAKTTASLMRLERQREMDRIFRQRLQANSTENLDASREALLGDAAHHRTGNRSRGGEAGQEEDMLLAERSRIDNSSVLLDMATDDAMAIRDDLYRQGASLHRSTGRITDLTNALPSMDGIIRRINARRRRDMVIMIAVMSTCSILFLLYIMS
ncbi:hypothetical protein BJ684DRAFT_20636 [Piptocephalis cylindrospora]|uniref:Protein transport protein BOS1 n=1 Tax=Piptocephalis cylindrospora TaxID=1907219 RepID=A0A4P9Y4U0_9FUNG|nr:hypothetical protein BJ684DRAFT_20636 [Piptocephalis cylindrospora]|eukprot:RKP12840.1 hypothetical protein BJ684DRAFT_20636 [Piptocephalis cylindrospora]